MKKISTLLFCFLFSAGVYLQAANLYLVGNTSSAWTTTAVTGFTVYKVDLSNSGANGTTAVSLTQWLNDRNTTTPTYLIGGSAGVAFSTADQIWIAGGTYNVAIAWGIGTAPSGLYGGFAGNETAVSGRAKGANPWDYTNETIINGSASTGGITNAGGARTITYDGITFTGCTNTQGQAVYQRPGMTIQNCKFTSNACVALRYYYGSALSTAAYTTNCYFYNNTYTVAYTGSGTPGTEGGCITAQNNASGGTYTISGCVFDSNSSTATGSGASAGLKTISTYATNVTNCIFKNNSATVGSSTAVSLTSTISTLTNCLIYGAPTGSVNALYITSGSLINCTVVNNLGGGAYMNNTTSSTAINLTNTVFWGSDSKSGQISAFTGTIGNITNCAYTNLSANFTGTNTSPVILTTTSTGVFQNAISNWTLVPGSPLLNAGTATGAPATDLVGVIRPQGSGIDIGAYELPYFNTTVTFNANGTINSYTSGAVDSKPQGTQLAFTITPNSGYKITSVLYNGTDVTGSLVGNVYTAPALTANSTLVVQFDLGTGLQKAEFGILCFPGSQSIELRGVTPGNEVTVYTVTGEKIKSEMIHSANISIAIPRGMYIVRILNQVTKIVVN